MRMRLSFGFQLAVEDFYMKGYSVCVALSHTEMKRKGTGLSLNMKMRFDDICERGKRELEQSRMKMEI